MLLGSAGLFCHSQGASGKGGLGLERGSSGSARSLGRLPLRVSLAKCCKLQRKPRTTNNGRNLRNQVPLDFMGSAILNTPTCLSGGKWAINSSLVVIKRM